MFGGGPDLTHDAKIFLCRLEAHPEIELLGAFCQSDSQTWTAIIRDLWRRRGILAFPLLIARIITSILIFLQNPRKEISLRHEIRKIYKRIYWVIDLHAHDVLDKIRSMEPDLGLIYGSPILRPILFSIPKFGTLGIHHGKVPEYRGNKTTFWAIFNGEATAGVTIQKINEGLDTGSIVKEGQVLINRRSYKKVWRDLEELGLDLYIQAILEVKNGTAIYKPQKGSKGRLYKNPKLKDFIIFWGKQLKIRFH